MEKERKKMETPLLKTVAKWKLCGVLQITGDNLSRHNSIFQPTEGNECFDYGTTTKKFLQMRTSREEAEERATGMRLIIAHMSSKSVILNLSRPGTHLNANV